MKKRVLALLIAASCALGLFACKPEAKIVSETESPASEVEPDSSTSDVQTEPASKASWVLNDDYNAWFVDSDNSVKELKSVNNINSAYIVSAGTFDKYMYVEVYDYTLQNSPYIVYVYDSEGNEKTSYMAPSDLSKCNAGTYENELYVINEIYNEKTEVLKYNPETDEFTVDSKFSEIAENINNNYAYVNYSMTLFDLLNNGDSAYVSTFDNIQNLYTFDTKTGTVGEKVVLDDDTLNSDYSFCGLWKNWVLMKVYDIGENDDVYTYLYDPNDYSLWLLSQSNISGLQGVDKYYYWYEQESKAYNSDVIKLMRIDVTTGNIENVWTKEQMPGDSGYYFTPGISGIKFTDDKIFYEDYGDNNVVLKNCNLDGSNEQTLDYVVHEYSWAEFATVSADIVTDYYEDGTNSNLKYGYYLEKPTLKSSVPNADAINAIIDSYYQNFTEYALQTREMRMEDSDDGYLYFCSNDITLLDIRKIGDRYLEIDLDGYDYTGGAHGMPFHTYLLFDLTTGAEVNFKDICGVDEETYKNLVASKAVEDAKNGENKELYFYSGIDDPETESEFYTQVYNDTEFAAWDVKFGDEGIFVEFPPYMYGPFASGFITISISYDELNMKM